MIEELTIGLNSWIVQDGNYGEFQTGDLTTFAVEFFVSAAMVEVAPPQSMTRSLQPMTDANYRVVCPIVYVAPGWWVIDVGIPVYCNNAPPPGAKPGQWLEGDIQLGVDHFSYFERLSQLPGAPPLIFEWVIESIDMQTAPFIETRPGLRERDRARRGWKRIAQTDAWRDDDGNAEYLLHCRLRDRTGRHSLLA